MRRWLGTGPMAALRHWLQPPRGRGVRDLVALFSIGQGLLRLLPGALMAPVSLLPSWLYGRCSLLVGIVLLLTGPQCRRLSWVGQLAAVVAAGMWLLLALDVVGVSWASCINALLIAASAANEVRAREC